MFLPPNRRVLAVLALCVAAGILPGCGNAATTQLTVEQQKDVELRKRTVFTPAVIAEHRLSGDDLKRVQYYISGTMNLCRKIKKDDKREIVGGKLVKSGGETVHELLIEKGTPGLCVSASGSGNSTEVLVSFEKGYALKFKPSYNSESRFMLDATSKGDVYWVQFDGHSDIYELPAGDAKAAYLLIDLESVNDVVTTRKKLAGQKLDDKK